MKDIKEYLLIKEAWGDSTNYKRELKNLIDTYNNKKEKLREKIEKRKRTGRGYISRFSEPRDVLKKYPISILVDKLGYKIQKESFLGRRGPKERINTRNAAAFLADKLDNGEVTPEQLAEWWEEYSTRVNKENYFNPEWIVKQLDLTKLFNPYDPDDTSVIDEMINNPERILYYMRTGYNLKRKLKKDETYNYGVLSDLKKEEKEELLTFYTEPQNLDKLHEIFKKSRNKFLRARPKYSESVDKWLEKLFTEYVEYDGCDLQDELEKELNADRTMYQGSNSFCDEAKEVVSCVMKALNKVYGLSANNYTTSVEDDWSGRMKKAYKYYHNRDTDDEKRRNFIKDCKNGMDIEVHKGGRHKTEHSSVVSSSFWSTSGYDIDVKITVYDPEAEKGKVVFDETFENVPLYSSYYSGGWD